LILFLIFLDYEESYENDLVNLKIVDNFRGFLEKLTSRKQ